MRSVIMGASAALMLGLASGLWADTSVPCGTSQCCNPQTNCGLTTCGPANSRCNCCFCGSGSIPPFLCCALNVSPLYNCTMCCNGVAPPGGGD